MIQDEFQEHNHQPSRMYKVLPEISDGNPLLGVSFLHLVVTTHHCTLPPRRHFSVQLPKTPASKIISMSDPRALLALEMHPLHASGGDTGSDATVLWAKQSLDQCREEHAICKLQACQSEPPKLPKRVVEITKTRELRLVEDCRDKTSYACLSHC